MLYYYIITLKQIYNNVGFIIKMYILFVFLCGVFGNKMPFSTA